MGISVAELKVMKSMIGFDGGRVKNGKYKAHRNRYCLHKESDPNPQLDSLNEMGYMRVTETDDYKWYSLNDKGLDLLGGYLDCKIEIIR